MAEPDEPTWVAVGRVGRAHGVRGEVAVRPLTDLPEQRFAPGARLRLTQGDIRPRELTVAGCRVHAGRLLLAFAGVADRDAAAALTGGLLETEPGGRDFEPEGTGPEETWWDRDLVGLRADLPDGRPLGRLAGVVHTSGQDRLAVELPDGRQVHVPFVRALVPVVDPPAGRVVVDPPEGLLEL